MYCNSNTWGCGSFFLIIDEHLKKTKQWLLCECFNRSQEEKWLKADDSSNEKILSYLEGFSFSFAFIDSLEHLLNSNHHLNKKQNDVLEEKNAREFILSIGRRDFLVYAHPNLINDDEWMNESVVHHHSK